MLKKVLATILILSLLCGLACIFASCNNNKTFTKASKAKDGYATVYIPEDRDLRILLLSDPQVDLTEKYKAIGCLGNDATYNFVKDLVKVNNPDLVIINGDLVMHDSFNSSTPYYKRYAEIFEELDVPWTFTFGNHDVDRQWVQDDATAEEEDSQCTKQTLIDYLGDKYPHCLIYSDDDCLDGSGNHFVNIRRKSGELVYTLCLFDCTFDDARRSYSRTPSSEQVRWYRDTIVELSAKEYGKESENTVQSMIFNHVDIPEFYKAWTEAYNDGNPTENYYYGHLLEGDYTDNYGDKDINDQIFSVAKSLGSTKAIFMCHHHDNDMSVEYEGIRLTFGQHSGLSHYYRTTQKIITGIIPDYSDLKSWNDVDFSMIDQYGNERGGTQISISSEGVFDIQPIYAKDVLTNFLTDYYIDYDAVASYLDNNDRFEGTVKRGTDRKWKIE